MNKTTKTLAITESEQKGIEAIIFLQDFAGIGEPKAKALAGWRGMSEHEKKHTLEVYKTLKPK